MTTRNCPLYDKENHVCREDGTAWCPNPDASFCETRLGAKANLEDRLTCLENYLRKGGNPP